MMAAKRGLTAKQKSFCEHYLETGNAEQAAKKAGYNARGNTTKLLQNTTIQKYLEERMEEFKSAKVADQQEIIEFLTSVMRGEVKEETLYGVGMGEQSVREIELSGKERLKAAELLGRRYAMFTDKQELTGEMVVINNNVPAED
jgi:phage terminase small subunit